MKWDFINNIYIALFQILIKCDLIIFKNVPVVIWYLVLRVKLTLYFHITLSISRKVPNLREKSNIQT
jgi:hypothetical protein